MCSFISTFSPCFPTQRQSAMLEVIKSLKEFASQMLSTVIIKN